MTRLCACNCGRDISHRSSCAKYHEDCATRVRNEMRNLYREHETSPAPGVGKSERPVMRDGRCVECGGVYAPEPALAIASGYGQSSAGTAANHGQLYGVDR